MIRYTRKQINKHPDRFTDAKFVLYDDVVELLEGFIGWSVEAGADESKLIEFFNSPD